MTQEQALEICKELMPDAEIQLERVHCIGAQHAYMDKFQVWDWSTFGKLKSLAVSERSWEHCIAILRAKTEEAWEQDNSPVDTEAA